MTLICALSFFVAASLVAAQNGDGGDASGNIPAVAGGGDAAGAVGSSTGIVKLSTGAIVAIAVVVFVVIVLGILTAVLFYQAKKRQWTVRETLRRSTRRVATGLKSAVTTPFTPRSPNPSKAKFFPEEPEKKRKISPQRKGNSNKGVDTYVKMDSLPARKDRENDLEKGQRSRVVVDDVVNDMIKREKEKRVGVAIGQPKQQQQRTQQQSQPRQQQTQSYVRRDSESSVSSMSDNGSERHVMHKPQKPSINIPQTGKQVGPPPTPTINRILGRK